MRVHLVGVCGTGMGSLALLFREAGHDVSGSDVRFDPPMGDVLREGGVTLRTTYAPENLEPLPDLVVVGNAIRSDNPEAAAALRMGLARTSMSAALRAHFLQGRKPLVVCGTHGKTTTSAMCAWILTQAGQTPGYFIGGVTKNLPRSAAIGRAGRTLASARVEVEPGTASPFVVEGDEYDAVYWQKQPKFLDYVGVGADDVAIVTSVEHDHIDIYPNEASYISAFRSLARAMPKGGLFLCAGQDLRAASALEGCAARVAYFGLEGDVLGDRAPHWVGAPAAIDDGMQAFDLYGGGVSCGRFVLPMPGVHNIRNAIAAIAACAEGFGVSMKSAWMALATFQGVRRRQELLGEPAGVRVYDDFAHHPTAVDQTLRGLRTRHPHGALWAVFEPRSATACRALHQEAYAHAFRAADRVLLAPLGRSNVPEAEQLDRARLARELGPKAEALDSVDAIVARVRTEARSGDTVALLSNGAFGGLPTRVLDALGARGPTPPARDP
jgi:UDP-N-acetylmuramate: L-alanyl-gamma-D-glutamyl-meso-diaminopimelate ligase